MRYIKALALLLLAAVNVSNATPVINEFCASNQSGLQDGDGDRSDWIEIYNPDAVSADLSDWYLTDSAAAKTKWRFPAVSIPAKGYLVVFASGKDRRVAGQPLHTNFSLGAGGEYLGLIQPDGQTAVSEFNPSFPAQFADLSYGTPTNEASVTLVTQTSTGNWMVPTSATNPASTWKNPSFVPSGWNSATLGIGYDTNLSGTNYLPEIGSGGNTQAAMSGLNASCYLRVPFTVAAGAQVSSLKLRMKYDDGFIAWLNGQPLMSGGTQLRRLSPTPVVWNSAATGSRGDSPSLVFEDFDVSESSGLLVEGQNVLCIQGMNQTTGSSDFLLRPELTGTVATAGGPLPPGYFATPTPGAKNSGSSGTVVPQEVGFSRADGTFTTNFNLTLSGALGDQQIRYTMDGSTPTAASTLYSAPFTISASTIVRARIYAPSTGALGFIGARHFESVATTISNYNSSGQFFKSSLPIMVLNNRGGGEIGDPKENVRVQIYDRDASGYATLNTTAVPQTFNASINIRGRSSSGFPKKSYGVEVHDENENGKDLSILGMPAGEDWALVGCYDFDRAFSRNAWIYEMSRQAGRWSPRTRLVEVFFNQDGNQLSYQSSDYRGVYILCETIRRGSDRVDIDDLQKGETTYPGVSGGFIFKVDSPESDEFSWKTNRGLPLAGTGGDNLVIHRPKLADLATQQSTYLKNYFQSFEDALYNEAATNFSTRNYRNYIDSASWADHNIFNGLAKNVDALRLSAYFYKDRAGKMVAGPLWDFDRSVNSTDGRDNDTNTWIGTGDATNYFTFAWWQNLFADVEFRQVYVDRWQKLRKGPLATANVNSVFDGYLAEFKPADTDNPAARDYTRWYSAGSNNISTEVGNMKSWLSARSAWIDSQFAQQPTIARASGEVLVGSTTTIAVPAGTTVYYTTDGSDPRAEGGNPSGSAQIYNGTPVGISESMRLTARAFRSGSYSVPATNWSGPVDALYLVNETYATASTLVVSGINYNPLGPDAAEAAAMPEAQASDFEWIELKNISAAPINLDGVSFAQDAPVSAITLAPFTLAPGARAVVARNAAAFTLRYGSAAAARIAGTWSGDGSLDNGGDAILLEDHLGNVIAEFAYDDGGSWPERADGKGSALEFTAEGPSDSPFAWRASLAVHGSPGLAQAAAAASVAVNEIRANTVLPAHDAIELYNGSAGPIDLGGWFLSNTSAVETAADYRTFRIPNGTVIPAGGHVVFEDTAFSPANEMPLDGNRGGFLHLISANPGTGQLLNFESEVEFMPTLAGVSYGASPDGSGNYVPLAAYTPGAANAAPRVGPVQVTEIHYHPAGSSPEFVELTNTGSGTENLGKWTLRGDVDYDFPASYPIASGESIVLVSFDPVLLPGQATAFRNQYAVPAAVRLAGPWSANDTLGNSGGTVRLRRLVPPPAEEPGYIGLMVEDEVNYLASAPWPTTASGTGSAIRRLGIYFQGSDPAAWAADAPSPGTGASGYAAWKFANFPVSGGDKGDDPDGDGLSNLAEYLLGTPPASFTALAGSIDPNDGEPRFVLDYTLRKDRDDGSLSALQSIGLQAWVPAEHDELVSTTGVIENRRAWLPVTDHGFLRLDAQDITPAP
ncbi:lamin tail domain-containing protein [Haloferula sp. BvORR071]|uniref:lamin tail domain-containing protein n=1 Tax=Haloferula sp. BvORR071 TaxID=1396141 RepID=UPI0005546607|nr:lamin tail domain-containing protein [Haloferula sp. BvORR071]